jgi:2-enoate reductase
MEAARIAALRGHKVTLYEKEGHLGGTVETLSHNPLNSEFHNLVEFLVGQMKKLKVNIRVCKTATAEHVRSLGPDVAIIAVGATMTLPEALNGKLNVLTHTEALNHPNKIGKKVIIQGLGYGSELAAALAENGKKVTLFGKGKDIAANISLLRRFFVLKRLTDIDVCRGDGDIPMTDSTNPVVKTGRRLKEMTASNVVLVDEENNEEVIPYDTYIVSMGRKGNDHPFRELEKGTREIYFIGDADKVGEITDAMSAANEVGRKI